MFSLLAIGRFRARAASAFVEIAERTGGQELDADAEEMLEEARSIDLELASISQAIEDRIKATEGFTEFIRKPLSAAQARTLRQAHMLGEWMDAHSQKKAH